MDRINTKELLSDVICIEGKVDGASGDMVKQKIGGRLS